LAEHVAILGAGVIGGGGVKNGAAEATAVIIGAAIVATPLLQVLATTMF